MKSTTRQEGPAAVSASAPGAFVLNRLAVLRRRAIRVMAVRYCAVAVAVAIVASEIAALALGVGAGQAAAFAGIGVTLSLTVAIVAAVSRAPTLIATAATVDRRQHLDSCATSGLQFAAATDPVALLVVRDAAAKLSACVPAQVFPLEYPRRMPWIIAVVTAASVFFSFSVTRQPTGERDAGRTASSSTGGSPARASNTRGATPGDGRTSPIGSTSPATNAIAKGTDPDMARPVVDRSAPGSTVPSSTFAPAGAPAAMTSTAGSSPQRPWQGSSTSPTVSNPSLRASTAGAASHGAAGLAAASGSQGSGAGAGRAGGTAQRGGGVKAGGLTESRNSEPVPRARPLNPVESARYRANWSHAQTAMAQERVPPALRKYVKDYFAAIRVPQR